MYWDYLSMTFVVLLKWAFVSSFVSPASPSLVYLCPPIPAPKYPVMSILGNRKTVQSQPFGARGALLLMKRVCVLSLSPSLFMCRYSNPTTTAVTTTTTAIAKLNGSQTTPLDVSGLSQCEIQGLLLGAHPSASSPGSVVVPASSPSLDQHHHHHHMTPNGVLMTQGSGSNLSIKREPEDLRKDTSKCPSRKVKFAYSF